MKKPGLFVATLAIALLPYPSGAGSRA